MFLRTDFTYNDNGDLSYFFNNGGRFRNGSSSYYNSELSPREHYMLMYDTAEERAILNNRKFEQLRDTITTEQFSKREIRYWERQAKAFAPLGQFFSRSHILTPALQTSIDQYDSKFELSDDKRNILQALAAEPIPVYNYRDWNQLLPPLKLDPKTAQRLDLIHSAFTLQTQYKNFEETIAPPQPDKSGTMILRLDAPYGQIEVVALKEIGQGYNAIVYCCMTLNETQVVVKVAKPGRVKSIQMEWDVYKDLKLIGFPVLDIVTQGYGVLLRPYVDPSFFADRIEKYTPTQQSKLEHLWRAANQYALVTGIPLDLKPDNLWWDGTQWLLVDTGPRLDKGDPNQFAYTLNSSSFDEYFETFFVKKKNEDTPLSRDVQLSTTLKRLVLAETDWELATTLVDYQRQVTVLKKKIVSGIHGNPTAVSLLLLQGITAALPITEAIRSNMIILEAVNDVNSFYGGGGGTTTSTGDDHIFNMMGANFMDYIKVVRKLREATTQFHKRLLPELKDALERYTGSMYQEMNQCLRQTNDSIATCDKQTQQLVRDAEQVLSDPDTPRLEGPLILFRAIPAGSTPVSTEIAQTLRLMEVGDLWEERAFMSTSIQQPPDSFVGRNCCLFLIHMKAGTPAYYIGKSSTMASEEEVILMPGTLLRLREKLTGKNGMKHFDKDGRTRRIDTFVFDCEHCDVFDRFLISAPPRELTWAQQLYQTRLKYQPQDSQVGIDRLGPFHLRLMNAIIPRNNEHTLRLVTWNVHEWKTKEGNNSQIDIAETLHVIDGDIVGLQECSGVTPLKTMRNLVSCTADSGSYGEKLRNELLCKRGVQYGATNTFDIGHERCLSTSILYMFGKTLLVGVAHFDAYSERNRLENAKNAVKALEELGVKHGTSNIILMGDFNSYRFDDYTEHNMQQLTAIKQPLAQGMNIFESIKYLEQQGYQDTFVQRSQALNMPNILPRNTTYYGGRIDFIFTHANFDHAHFRLSGCYVFFSTASDHVAVIADFTAVGESVEKFQDDLTGGGADFNSVATTINYGRSTTVDSSTIAKDDVRFMTKGYEGGFGKAGGFGRPRK